MELLDEHVTRFDHGVRTGEWEPFGAIFASDAELRFEGVPVGPFHGREAIVAAYAAQPPDDEIALGAAGVDADETVVPYAWAAAPAVPAGELRLRVRDGLIERLVVVYGA